MSFERTSSMTAASMSDESRFLVGNERPLTDAETQLLSFLIRSLPGRDNLQLELQKARAYTMNDGRMGSLRFAASRTDRRSDEVLEARTHDVDGTALEIALNLDHDGHLFELDIWKVDFSPLLQLPEPGQVQRA